MVTNISILKESANYSKFGKDIGKNPHDVASYQVYHKKYEPTSIPETNNVNHKPRLHELRETSENTSDIKIDIVEYIKECSKEQQQILSIDNRKNHKLLNVSIKRKKDNVTEPRLDTLDKKESYQQLDTSTIKITKFRSNTNERSFLSTNEELQLDTSFTQGHFEKNVKNTNTCLLYTSPSPRD